MARATTQTTVPIIAKPRPEAMWMKVDLLSSMKNNMHLLLFFIHAAAGVCLETECVHGGSQQEVR